MKKLILIFLLLLGTIAYAALPAWLGCSAEPFDADDSCGATVTYIMDGQTCAEAGEVTKIEAYIYNETGDLEFAVFSKNGNDFTDEHYTGMLATSGTVLHTWTAGVDFTAIPIEIGEYIGFNTNGNPSGRLERETSGGTGYWTYSGDAIGDDDADTFIQSGNTTWEIQFRFYITAVDGEANRRSRVTKLLGR